MGQQNSLPETNHRIPMPPVEPPLKEENLALISEVVKEMIAVLRKLPGIGAKRRALAETARWFGCD